MLRLLISNLILAFFSCPLAANEVKPPRGWSVESVGDRTFIGNDNATVTVGPWQSLGKKTADVWLSELGKIDPADGEIISVEKVKPETVDGAFSIIRRAKFGRNEGVAVLYSCPGRPGEARLLTLDVRNGSFTDTVKGALYGEKVCKAKIATLQQSVTDPVTKTKNKNSKPQRKADTVRATGLTAEELNDQIPAELRPTTAELYTDWVWQGFPAQLTLKLVMALTFKDGTKLGCSNWNPDGRVTLDALASERKCAVPGEKATDPIYGFTPGQTLNLQFGNLGGFSIDGIEGSAGSLQGGDLVMTANGEIAIGKWNVAHASSNAATARATATRRRGLTGHYYTNGHTITIVTHEGEVLHGLVGFSRDKNGVVDTVYLNGRWYRDFNN